MGIIAEWANDNDPRDTTACTVVYGQPGSAVRTEPLAEITVERDTDAGVQAYIVTLKQGEWRDEIAVWLCLPFHRFRVWRAKRKLIKRLRIARRHSGVVPPRKLI